MRWVTFVTHHSLVGVILKDSYDNVERNLRCCDKCDMQVIGDKFHAIFVHDHDVLRMKISVNVQFSTDEMSIAVTRPENQMRRSDEK